MMAMKTKSPSIIFYTFLIIFILEWTLLPTIFRHSLGMDAAEGSVWSRQLAWGYNRDPWMSAWLTRFALFISNGGDWSTYLFSQLSVATGMTASWKLAKRLLPEPTALIAIMMLSAIPYYSLNAIDFNDNVLLIAFWPLILYATFLVTDKPEKVIRWILLGIFCGLGLMAKYYTILLIASLLAFIACYHRHLLLQRNFYFASFTTLLICTPHLIWLYHHGFIVIRYITQDNASPLLNKNLWGALRFLYNQFFTLAGGFVLLLFCYFGKAGTCAESQTVKKSHKTLLLFAIIGPVVLTVSAAILFKIYLRSNYGMPIYSSIGILFLSYFPPKLSCARLRNFILASAFVMLASSIVYSTLTYHRKGSANYPMQKLAKEITRHWHQRYHSRLMYVAGERKAAVYISKYSPDHPTPLIDSNFSESLNIDPKDFYAHGAVFVKYGNNIKFTKKELTLFPGLQITKMSMPFYNSNEPFVMNVAFLAPTQK